MSSQVYQPPIYQIPSQPSQQLKVVLDHFDNLKRWDFNTLSKLYASGFTQQVLPASLGSSLRTKNKYIEYLHNLRDSLKGAPLEMIIYEVNESKGKIWVHAFIKSVKIEVIFNFMFGTGKDKNLIVNFTEFVDSKVYAGGDNSGYSVSRSSNLNAQPEPSAQPDLETHTQAPST